MIVVCSVLASKDKVCRMDDPQCVMLSMVKIEDDRQEVKQEPLDEEPDMDVVQSDESGLAEEISSEPTIPEHKESMESVNSLLMFCEEDVHVRDRPVDMAHRRRLRFSEADDLLLLSQVVAQNPYRCSVLWKDITRLVATRTGKNFSVRAVRDHTDLLMNTFNLRGPEACLKRTPPEYWEKKKRLLRLVYSIWKKEFTATKTPVSDADKGNKEINVAQKPLLETCSKASVTSRCSTSLSKSGILSSLLQPTSESTSAPVVVHPKRIPVAFHIGTSVPSRTCSLQQSMSKGFETRTCLEQLNVVSGVPPMMTDSKGKGQTKAHCMLGPNVPPDLIKDTISAVSSEPLALTISRVPSVHNRPEYKTAVVSRSTSPIPAQELATKISPQCPLDALLSQSSSRTVDVSTSTSSSDLAERLMYLPRRRQKSSPKMRARLKFVRVSDRNQFILRKQELDLERRRLLLEEKKLALEERRVQLEEEKWQLEREEKKTLLARERDHKTSAQKKQQDS